jgi:hypothetical protein
VWSDRVSAMQKSMKALLLSMLVFPGSGHLYLKKYVTGSVLALISLAALYYLVDTAIEHAMQIVDKIQTGAVTPDVASISALVENQAASGNTLLANLATTAMLVCWVVGMIDSYRLGKRAEPKNTRPRGRQ